MAEFYVWIFPPSAVRDGYQVGAYAKDTEARVEIDLTREEYDEDQVANLLWDAVRVVDADPTFYSACRIDAPMSAALRDHLDAKRNSPAPEAQPEESD